MKVGDYVRTKNGDIFKYVKYDEQEKQYRRTFSSDNPSITTAFKIENVIKSSPNIIDLIEVGDYVNGHKVIDIAQAPKRAVYIEDSQNKMAHIPYTNNDIKSIVTKEQFESMEYRIGE